MGSIAEAYNQGVQNLGASEGAVVGSAAGAMHPWQWLTEEPRTQQPGRETLQHLLLNLAAKVYKSWQLGRGKF